VIKLLDLEFGIGIGELSAFHATVVKKVDTEKISYGRARDIFGSYLFNSRNGSNFGAP
jgi:hypothetical protein